MMNIEELKEKIGDRVLVVSVSGGKDSTATCLHLKELGLPYKAMFFNTGWEHKSTYDYVNNYLPTVVGPIEILSREPQLKKVEEEELARKYEERLGFRSPMVRWVIKKKIFPSRMSRFCTTEMKVLASADYLKTLDDEPLNVVGIRAEESRARAQMVEWEWFDAADCEVWRPLLKWKVQDVIDIHKRHNVSPNPLYLGRNPMSRVGCYPCIYARKKEIATMASRDQERMEIIADLEKDMLKLSLARAEARGEKLDVNKLWRNCWFSSNQRQPKEGEERSLWTIDKVIDWARTTRGGRQYELFDALPGEQGCVRWGMCDTGQGDKK